MLSACVLCIVRQRAATAAAAAAYACQMCSGENMLENQIILSFVETRAAACRNEVGKT